MGDPIELIMQLFGAALSWSNSKDNRRSAWLVFSDYRSTVMVVIGSAIGAFAFRFFLPDTVGLCAGMLVGGVIGAYAYLFLKGRAARPKDY
jgi:hypothetical protein